MLARIANIFSKPSRNPQPESKPRDFGPPDGFGPVANEELKLGHFKKGIDNKTSYKNLLKNIIVHGGTRYAWDFKDKINPHVLQLQNALEEINTKNNRYDIINGIETVDKENLNYFVTHIDDENLRGSKYILELNSCLTIALFCDYHTYIHSLSYHDASKFWAFPLTRCLLEYCDFVDIENYHDELIEEMFKQNNDFIIPSKYISPSTKIYNEYDVYKKQKSTQIYDTSSLLRLDYEKKMTMEEAVEKEQLQNALEQTKLSDIFKNYKSRARAAADLLKDNLKKQPRGGRAGKKTRMNKRHSFRNKNRTRRRARK